MRRCSLDDIRRMSLGGGGQIDEDTFVGAASFTAAVHAAGGACEMVRALVRGDADAAFCGLRPSGHHAGRDRAMGFCLFNNVAIAAELAIRELGLERVFILDWDVHHGNGTADVFRRRSDVLFASIHQAGTYPGTGGSSDVGSGDGSRLYDQRSGSARRRRGDVGLGARARHHPGRAGVPSAADPDLRGLRRSQR